MLALVACRNMHLEQMNVKIIFLHGDLQEEIYMKQLEGFSKGVVLNKVTQNKCNMHERPYFEHQNYMSMDREPSSTDR